MAASFDSVAFARLQDRLRPMWPTMTIRGRPEERTVVVLSSISVDVPPSVLPLLPAYEERYLIYVLGLLRAPKTTVIYVTSQPVLPRMIDYYLGLIPGLDRAELRSRLVAISVGDWSPRPLTEKILERPLLIERIRSLVTGRRHSVILPFVTTELEARLALLLDVPVYGPHPDLACFGTKTGSRAIFKAAGVAHPLGTSGIRSQDDLVTALEELVDRRHPAEAIVKLDDAVSGFGNAVVDLRDAGGREELRQRVLRLQPEDDSRTPVDFLDALEREGGIVEERISGADFRSPSVQLRASPEGGVEVLSTHDQILGGPMGQTYFGCRFPADGCYVEAITEHGRSVGEELARRGAIGRFGVDFVAVSSGREWDVQAVEINLRNGGTTHPMLTLLALTDGDYDPDTARFTVAGVDKHYVATDHLETPNLRSLTPDDVLDLVDAEGLGWDDTTSTGVVLHMVSGVAVAGRVGLTAIGDSPSDADARYLRAEAAIAGACS